MLAFAYFMLFAWPLVVWRLFSRLDLANAAAWSIIGGYLLLPQRLDVDLPLLPAYGRNMAAALPALLCCISAAGAVARRRGAASRAAGPGAGAEGSRAARTETAGQAGGFDLDGWIPRSWVIRLLLLGTLIGPLFTAYANRAPLSYGPVTLPAMSMYDAISAAMVGAMLLLPLLIARRVFASASNQRILLTVLTVAGLWYTIPMVMEIRLAPQLHKWVYGYFTFGMGQQARYGAFRPVVFLQHGLWTAMYTAMAMAGAAALWRWAKGPAAPRAMAAFLWLAVMLVLCRTVGALALALIIMPVIVLFTNRPRTMLTVAAAIAVFALLYPTVRNLGLIPTDRLVEMVSNINADRGLSLLTRFNNENELLAHAASKPMVGWGSWDRWRIFDSETGTDLTTADGLWVTIFSVSGWIGYVSLFGMLCVPILLVWRVRGRPGISPESGVLALILAMNLADMLLNASRTPITFLLCGALIGHAELVARGIAVTKAAPRRRAAAQADPQDAPTPTQDGPRAPAHTAAPSTAPPRTGPVRPVKPRWGGRPD
jgi:hypothetical protein